ncbi:MAG: glycosyltransferase family 4 protein [Phormidesmis sp.]
MANSIRFQKEDSPKPVRVLLIAERANPEYASIPLRGWCHSRAIADLADAHIVTQHWNGPAYLRAGFTNFTGINTSLVHEPMKLAIAALRGGKGKGWTVDTALSALEYYFFEFMLWKKFGPLIQSGKFDIVHRLIPSSPTVPSLIAAKCKKAGIPFVLGPINGGLPWPQAFNTARHEEKEWLSYIRDMYRLMPGYKSTREQAAAIIVGSQSTLTQVAEPYRDKCIYFPANAVDIEQFQNQRQNSAMNSGPIKLIFVGRLVPYKGADMLIEAAADLLKASKLTLKILGDGPQHDALAAQIKENELTDSVTLVGKVPREQLQDYLSAADVFVFPSIREFGGATVLEAMAIGLLPVVVDYGGPGEMVTPAVGYKVPLGDRTEIVERFRQVLGEIVAHPEKIDVMGQRSRQRILDKFTWQERAQQTLDVYRWVLSKDNISKPTYDYSG